MSEDVVDVSLDMTPVEAKSSTVKRRSRTTKPKQESLISTESIESSEGPTPSSKRKGRSTKKGSAAYESSDDTAVESLQHGDTHDSNTTSDHTSHSENAKTLEHSDASDIEPESQAESSTRSRRHRRDERDSESQHDSDESAQRDGSSDAQSARNHSNQQSRRENYSQQGQSRNRQNGYSSRQYGQNQQGRRNKDRRQQRELAIPKTDREQIDALKLADLRAQAQELGIDAQGKKKPELVELVYNELVRQEGFFDFKGILDLANDGTGYVRLRSYLPADGDIYIAGSLVRSMGLRRGDEVTGVGYAPKGNEKLASLNKVLTVNGRPLEDAHARQKFSDLTPVFPTEPLIMEHGKDSILGRCIDLVAPIGKGQRGLIVSPPKAGKTTVLKKIAESVAANNPEVHLMCLLVDERPEEVTDMQRSIRGEVVASTFDMPSDNHITVAELVIERAKRLVELGEDVVILLDSITRLARAYNLAQPASGRILSGGVDSTALYPPKRFLGAARNIEGGGSLTILASALVDTGSKMDEVIFEEFKGTGNMELKLDRDLADRRVFPAIDPITSGTRKEELLLDANLAPFVWGLRRVLANMNSNERAMTSLIRGLRATKTNEEFLIRTAKKTQGQDIGEL